VIFHKSLNKNNPTLPDEANDRAFYSKEKNEFFLMYDDVRLSANPEKVLLDFLPKHLRNRRHSRKGGSRKSRSKRRKELISAASIRIHAPRSRHPLLIRCCYHW
jgi:hypothetical protein